MVNLILPKKSQTHTMPQIQELDDIHKGLNTAVLDTYGWPHKLTDEEILERLLALNLERAKAQENSTEGS
jgi:hypothetical protein